MPIMFLPFLSAAARSPPPGTARTPPLPPDHHTQAGRHHQGGEQVEGRPGGRGHVSSAKRSMALASMSVPLPQAPGLKYSRGVWLIPPFSPATNTMAVGQIAAISWASQRRLQGRECWPGRGVGMPATPSNGVAGHTDAP